MTSDVFGVFLTYLLTSPKGASINYVVSGGRGVGSKIANLLSKKTTKRGEGVKNHRF